MQVQPNKTTNSYKNLNFNASFSKSAQAYLNKELKYLECRSHDELYGEYYKECEKFAKEIIEGIKNIKERKPILIDINENGDMFVCKEYKDIKDIGKKSNKFIRSWIVPKNIINPFVEVLMILKNSWLLKNPTEYANKTDYERYNKIGRYLQVREDDFRRNRWPYDDVRWQDISTHYSPLQFSMVSGFDKNGKHYCFDIRGTY